MKSTIRVFGHYGVALEEYLQTINTGMARIARLEEKMLEMLKDWEWEPIVRALMAQKGFQIVAAMITIAK